ncbi:MAG TPA: TlpA disulfide reductase family protein [Rhodospirillales bacterium]|nr:TlpA disulfide reductase family protein [Rhodospirillales bacterium]
MAGMRVGILVFGLAVLAILTMTATGASASGEPRAACAAPPAALGKYQPAKPDAALPAAPFVDAEGVDRPLDGLRGQALVLNVWATWCAPCVEEMPALDRLAAQTKQTGVRVLALSADREGGAVVRRFYEVNAIRHLPVALDKTARVARATGIGGLPTTLLYDAAGREIGRVTGVAAWDSSEVTAFLAACLAGRG